MANKFGNKKKELKPVNINEADSDLAKYIYHPYFVEKDKKAQEFLKKHPIPRELLK